jgi:hypothetical protein
VQPPALAFGMDLDQRQELVLGDRDDLGHV